MPKISEEAWESRRQQILVAALRCFARHGMQSTSIEQIIAESGMSTSAMYRYFQGKSDIIVAATSKNLHDFAAIAIPAVEAAASKDPSVFLKEMLATLEKFAQRDGYNLKAVIVQAWGESFTNPPLAALLREMYSRYFDILCTLAKEWKRRDIVSNNVRASEIASFIMSGLLGVIVQSCILGTKPTSFVAGFDGFRRTENGGK